MMNRTLVLIVTFVLWMGPPLAMALTMAWTPNVVVAQSDVGAFIASQPLEGHLYFEDGSWVHTDAGAFAVDGIFSAPRGEALVIRQSTIGGLQVCAKQAADVCSDLIGTYLGVLQPVHPQPWLDYDTRSTLKAYNLLWAIVGAVFFLFAFGRWIESNNDRRDGDEDADRGASS